MNLVDVVDLPTDKYQACTVNDNILEIVTESGQLYKCVASCNETMHLQQVERLFNCKERRNNHSWKKSYLTLDLCVDLASVLFRDSYLCTRANNKVEAMCAVESTLWLATSSGKVYLFDCNRCELIKNNMSVSFNFFGATERPCALTAMTSDDKCYVAIRTECGEVFVIDAHKRTRIAVLSLNPNHAIHASLSNTFTFDNNNCLYVCDEVTNTVYACNVLETPIQLVECVMEKSSAHEVENNTSKTDTKCTTTIKQTLENSHLLTIYQEREKKAGKCVDKIIKLVYDDVWRRLYVCFTNSKIDVFKVVEPQTAKNEHKLEQICKISLPHTCAIGRINERLNENFIVDIIADDTSLFVFTKGLDVAIYDLCNYHQKAMYKLNDNLMLEQILGQRDKHKHGISKTFAQNEQKMRAKRTSNLQCRQVFQLQSKEAKEGFVTLLNYSNCNHIINSSVTGSSNRCFLCYWQLEYVNNETDTIVQEGTNCASQYRWEEHINNNYEYNELQKDTNDIKELQEQGQRCTEENGRVHDALLRKGKTLSSLSDKISKEQMELVRLEECNRRQTSEIQELRLRLMSADKEKENVMNEVTKYKKELDKLGEQLNTKCKEANQATVHCASVERDYNRAQTEIAQLQKEIREWQAQHALCITNKSEERKQLEVKEMEKYQLERQLQEMMAKLTSCCNENKRLVSYAFTSRLPLENVNKTWQNEKVKSNEDVNSKIITNVEPTNNGSNTNSNNNKEVGTCKEMPTKKEFIATDNDNDTVESLRSCLRSALYTIRRYEEENRDLVQLFNSTATMLAGRVSSERLHALFLATMIRHPVRFELRCSEAEKAKILNENRHFISFLNSLHAIDNKSFDKLMCNLQKLKEELQLERNK